MSTRRIFTSLKTVAIVVPLVKGSRGVAVLGLSLGSVDVERGKAGIVKANVFMENIKRPSEAICSCQVGMVCHHDHQSL